MRILHVITLGELGGAQRYVAELARRQRSCGYRVEIAAGTTEWLAQCSNTFDRIHSAPALVREISPRRDLSAVCALLRIVADGEFDVVHTHSAKAGILGRLAGTLCHVDTVAHTSHGTVLAEKLSFPRRMIYWSAERIATAATTRLFAVSEAERIFLSRAMRVPPESIKVMTIVPDYIRQLSLTWSPDANVGQRMVAVGNLYRNKAYDVLIEALALLLPRFPRLRLTICGTGPEDAALRSLTAARGLSDRVDFAGQVSDIPQRLASGGIFVMASRKEGLPLALLEAMAVGMPIVATRVGAVAEVLGPEIALVRPDDVAHLAHVLSNVLASSDAQAALAASARHAYENLLARDDLRAACKMYE